jgi:16S rRNA (cytosine1402-N4)-methyltransferase
MKHNNNAYHIPVLARESLDGLQIIPSGIYVDATFGGGGHSAALLERLGPGGTLYGFDQDADAAANAPSDSRFIFVRSNFRYIYNFMRYYKSLGNVDGLIADLGVSSHHFDNPSRGFSYRFTGPLDMRMNAQSSLTAAHIATAYPEEKLASVLAGYGELKQSRQIAAAVVKARRDKPVDTIERLVETVEPFAAKGGEKKFLSQLFMALRMEVNDEIESLKELLLAVTQVLKPGGRFAVISYHSLEDRLVKNYMKTGNFEGKPQADFYGNVSSPFRLINRKVITPPPDETARNPRSRSAKLRVAELV